MEMLLDVVVLIVGFVLLIKGADWFAAPAWQRGFGCPP